MDKFVYQYPVRQYFGKGCAESAIKEEVKCAGHMVCASPAAYRIYSDWSCRHGIGYGRRAEQRGCHHARREEVEATVVRGIKGETTEGTASQGIDTLESFIKAMPYGSNL